ncbi:MAG TPA: class I SAM-dependent methyltransferase [Nitrospirota bacterium]|nr:class I SAM-dependent methyltransferase [Nitrospirota bacterium]
MENLQGWQGDDRRSGSERRRPIVSNFPGPDVRSGKDRRYQDEDNRLKTASIGQKPEQAAIVLNAKIEQYIRQLGNLEPLCDQPDVDQGKLLSDITTLTDSVLEACAKFEQTVSDTYTIKAAQLYFRDKTNPILSKSYCINRCRTWPRGQQGDFETLELAYKNTPLSEGIGFYLDKYLLSSILGAGVRERILKLRDLLQEELKNRHAPKVLDVACGSCREVFELAPEIESSGAKFTCVDLDPSALDFARDRFSHAGLLSDNVELLTYNALRMFDYETAQKEFGLQDIIYSVGYFDYLPDDFLVKLLNTLYNLLNPAGVLIMAYKDAARYRPQVYHWLVDWDGFKQRIESDFDRLFRLAGIPNSALSVTRVGSGTIVFYLAKKK